MKIVHSFWSKPFRQQSNSIQNRSSGGWLNRKYNYMCWAYSCLQFNKFYDRVDLVTDHFGKKLLIDYLGLPYTDCQLELEKINDYHPDLWAIGKLFAYQLQEEPFIHADGDVIIWKKFDKELENASLIAQSQDNDFDFYHDSLNQIFANFKYIAKPIQHFFEKDEKKVYAINAGLIGGNNIDFFKSFVQQALKFVHQNEGQLSNIKIGKFNPIYEQYLFRCLAREEKLDINYYYPEKDINYFDFVKVTEIPKSSQYFHAMGLFKKDKYLNREIEYRFREDYPEYYDRIEDLLKKSII